MAVIPKAAKITEFFGLNNKADPVSDAPGHLLVAENVDVDNKGAIRRREGYTTGVGTIGTLVSTAVVGDELFALCVSGGVPILYYIGFDSSGTPVVHDADSYPTTKKHDAHFLVLPDNRVVLFLGGEAKLLDPHSHSDADFFVPTPASPDVAVVTGELPAGRYLVTCVHIDSEGREGGAPSPTVVELTGGQALTISWPTVAGHTTRVFVSPPDSQTLYQVYEGSAGNITWSGPVTALVTPLDPQQLNASYPTGLIQTSCVFAGQLWLSQYSPEHDQTVIWKSRPFWYHIFNQAEDFDVIPGRVTMMKSINEQTIIIGTDSHILAQDVEGNMTELADYGAVPGSNGVYDGNTLYFWTTEGVCRALPFENITEERVSLPPGTRCSTMLVEREGLKQLIVSTQGSSEATNPY